MKNKNTGTIPKSNIKIVERGKINTPNGYIHDRSLSWLGTVTSIRSGGVKLLSWSRTSSPREMMRPSSAFQVWVKCPSSHIIGEQFYFKECYNLEHYIHFFLYLNNIINLRDIEVVTYSIILVLLKKADGFNKNINIR